ITSAADGAGQSAIAVGGDGADFRGGSGGDQEPAQANVDGDLRIGDGGGPTAKIGRNNGESDGSAGMVESGEAGAGLPKETGSFAEAVGRKSAHDVVLGDAWPGGISRA